MIRGAAVTQEAQWILVLQFMQQATAHGFLLKSLENADGPRGMALWECSGLNVCTQVDMIS